MGHQWIRNDELNCPFCLKIQDKDVIHYLWNMSNNVTELNTICDHCKKTLRLRQTNLGFLILRKYVKHYKPKQNGK
jgi:hypothetical protein